jgi:hypothetical protein
LSPIPNGVADQPKLFLDSQVGFGQRPFVRLKKLVLDTQPGPLRWWWASERDHTALSVEVQLCLRSDNMTAYALPFVPIRR